MATNINNIVTGLDYDQMKQQVPEPFFTEYAKFFCIPVVDQRGQRRPHVDLTHEIILQGGIAESEPRVVPVLDNHDARYIDGILHFHRRTPKEMRDAAGLKSLERGVVDFPVQRFEELEDLDMDEEERAKRVKVKGKGKKREREAAAAQGTRPMMEFMFPPVGRRVAAPTEGEVEREPVPEDYLGEMVADLKNEAKAAKQELAAAQAALQSAVYNYEALQVEIEQERAEWGKLLDYVKSVAGQEVVNEVLRRADGRARGRIFEDEIPEVVATEEVIDPDLYWISCFGSMKKAAAPPATPAAPTTFFVPPTPAAPSDSTVLPSASSPELAPVIVSTPAPTPAATQAPPTSEPTPSPTPALPPTSFPRSPPAPVPSSAASSALAPQAIAAPAPPPPSLRSVESGSSGTPTVHREGNFLKRRREEEEEDAAEGSAPGPSSSRSHDQVDRSDPGSDSGFDGGARERTPGPSSKRVRFMQSPPQSPPTPRVSPTTGRLVSVQGGARKKRGAVIRPPPPPQMASLPTEIQPCPTEIHAMPPGYMSKIEYVWE